jgi:hypothetical protein
MPADSFDYYFQQGESIVAIFREFTGRSFRRCVDNFSNRVSCAIVELSSKRKAFARLDPYRPEEWFHQHPRRDLFIALIRH